MVLPLLLSLPLASVVELPMHSAGALGLIAATVTAAAGSSKVRRRSRSL